MREEFDEESDVSADDQNYLEFTVQPLQILRV